MSACAAPYFNNVLAYDANPYIVAMWDCVLNGWMPPESVSEHTFNYIAKHYTESTDKKQMAIAGFILSGCAYGGIFARAYAKQIGRDFAQESRAAVMRKAMTLSNATFEHSDYKDLKPPYGSIVYCDPPYANTVGYRFGNFEHAVFWSWAEEISRTCFVFVSEKVAPPEWKSIWAMPIQNSISKTKNMTERLFVLDDSTAKA